MNYFLLLIANRFHIVVQAVLKRSKAQRIISALFLVVILIFMGTEFGMFFSIFRFLKNQDVVGQALTLQMLHLAFFLFFTTLLVSNIVSAIPTVFHAKEIQYLFSLPVPSTSVFAYAFTNNLLYSSWATVILGFPLLIAFGVTYAAHWWLYPAAFFVLLFFVIIPAALGVLLTLCIAAILQHVRWRHLLVLIVLFAGLNIVAFLRSTSLNNVVLPDVESFTAFNKLLSTLRSAPFYFPSTWLVDSVRALLAGRVSDIAFNAFLLLTTAAASVQATLLVAKKLYVRGFRNAWETRSLQLATRIQKATTPSWLTRKFPSPGFTLIVKDFRLFWRDVIELSQVIFLGVLLALYLAILGHLPVLDTPASAFWATIISYVSFGITGYIVATYAVRFLFPAISLEGRSAWILWSAPITNRVLLTTKFLFGFVPLLLLTEGLSLWSGHALGLAPLLRITFAAIIFFMTLTLTSLSLGIGALFPNFRESNPSSLASSGLGLVTVLGSLAYVAIIIIILAIPLHSYFIATLSHHEFSYTPFWFALAAILVVSLALSVPAWMLGLRQMRKYTF